MIFSCFFHHKTIDFIIYLLNLVQSFGIEAYITLQSHYTTKVSKKLNNKFSYTFLLLTFDISSYSDSEGRHIHILWPTISKRNGNTE